MKKSLWHVIIKFACVAVSTGALSVADAQTSTSSYPNKPIRYIVPFAAGGATDTVARVISEKLSEKWKESIVVENKTGGSGNVGTVQVARAAPDGYTMLMTINSFTINRSLYKKLPYDPIKDFSPVILAATSPNVLVVNPQVPAKSVKELIELARSKPGQLSYASAGAGSGAHLAGELFSKMANVKMLHVPYKGASATMADLISGRVTMSFIALPVAFPYIKSGQLRALALTTTARSSLAPDLPTIAESGLPGYEVTSWFGTFAPKGTPADIVMKWNKDVGDILKMPEVSQKLQSLALEPQGGSPQDFAKFIEKDWRVWDKLIKEEGIQLD
ncbi:MAG TPA: tripartite tricarboxylate transporter substrate binding protein [Eoetvoesiella sp.]